MPELREVGPETLEMTGQKRKNSVDHETDQPKKRGVPLSAMNSNFIEVDWATADATKGKGGRKRHLLNELVVVPGYYKDDPKKMIIHRCVGKGCDKVYEKRSGYRERFWMHVPGCNHVSADLKQRVSDAQGSLALGNELAM